MAKGDQIYVYREFLNLQGAYEHHGIDCGDGSVIHYRKPSEIIERTSLETFARGGMIYTREYSPSGYQFIADVVVRRAESRLGEQKYNLLFNNCEHFATWCKTGISDSRQIRDFVPVITHLQAAGLYEPLKRSLVGADPDNAKTLLHGALGNLKVSWDEIQPRYKTALEEIETWNKVAVEALARNRDDLARRALERKVAAKKEADRYKEELDRLAAMTENVLKTLVIADRVS
ncbi:lecithin retinol acyltransferase family protein [Pannus brasiliensis CCIBt3594]|uniref:Lecithin retinol acyltransferase family protein n=1 Tax=Pannus brasiliensis CCIBt3594 TaxID=1427578 RepID=A0AAW9R238_9CHRO